MSGRSWPLVVAWIGIVLMILAAALVNHSRRGSYQSDNTSVRLAYHSYEDAKLAHLGLFGPGGF